MTGYPICSATSIPCLASETQPLLYSWSGMWAILPLLVSVGHWSNFRPGELNYGDMGNGGIGMGRLTGATPWEGGYRGGLGHDGGGYLVAQGPHG